ncbi:MAG: alginate export family protein [Acidobacteria bacterium]|nr:alginate export family protein [Acidobacteriota bacterium]
MLRRRNSVLSIFCLLLFFPALLAIANDTQPQKEQAANTKKRLKDIPVGPFHLDLAANIRLRAEYQSGFDVRRYEPDTKDRFMLTRIMLDLSLRFDLDRRLFVQFRDAHAPGTRLKSENFIKSNPFEDLWDIRQLYFEWNNIGGSPLGARIGRQQISYGDQRIFGPGLWGNTGRYAWDAAMLKIDTPRIGIDAWIGRPVKNRPEVWPNREFDAPVAAVIYGSVKKLPFRLDVFYAGKYDGKSRTNGESGTGDLKSHSIGFQLQKPAREWLDFTAAFISQTGHYGKDSLRAFGSNAAVGMTFPVKWRPRLAGQFTWGSGDTNPADGIHGTFDGVFGGADINFYGDLNLFFWANLRDYEWDLHLQPARNMKLMFEHHYFTLDQARDAWYTTGMAVLRRDLAGNSGTALGHEINLRFSWVPIRGFEVLAGWGRFIPGNFVKASGQANAASGLFLQTAYDF